MNTKFKYILYLLSVCGVFSSCSSDKPDYVETEENGSELTFEVSDMTRATVTTDIKKPGSKFIVYGSQKSTKVPDASPFIIMSNAEVEYKDNRWQYGKTQYMFPEYEYSFIAVYPLSVVNEENNPRYSGSALTFSHALPLTSGNEISRNSVEDILTATHLRYCQPNDSLPVSFRFTHLLTLINIAPAFTNTSLNSDSYIQIRKIEFSGLKSKADFRIMPAPRLSNNQTDDRVVEVANHEGDTKMTIEFAQPKKIMNGAGNQSLFDSSDAIIMLPQTFAADSKAKITLTYTINEETELRVVSSPLRMMSWETGKNYTFNFTLDGTHIIQEKHTITDWISIVSNENEATSE